MGDEQVPSFEEHLGDFERLIAPYDTGALVLADRHTYEVAANWKVVAENYHECYHCPLIHPELCQVSPPDSGENYVLPGAWIGGSMDLRDEMATMSMTGELAGTPLPGVDPRRVEYLHLLPNLLVSAHPDYVMAHRIVPLAPGRTWIECSWYVAPGGATDASGPSTSGRSPTSRTGLPASRCSGVWPARTSAPDRSRRERTRSPTSSPRSVVPTGRAGCSLMTARRHRLAALLVVAALAACWPAGSHHRSRRARVARTHKVGSLTLRPCDVVEGALCGSMQRAWEPGNPAAGKVKVGFAFVPAQDTSKPALGTLVPHEGGPGYSTTGTGEDYAAMYGPLLQRRNLLLVDQRGTGRSEPINCPALQNLTIAYNVAAARCAQAASALAPTTTPPRCPPTTSPPSSASSASAMSTSTATPTARSSHRCFVGRHPSLVRSVILDSAYPAYGESAWYPTQGPAMRRAFTAVCQRSAACRNAGRPFLATLRKVLSIVRAAPVARRRLRRRRRARPR